MAGRSDQPRYAVRRTVGGSLGYNGRTLDRGQLFTIDGIPGDERLERLGFIERIDGKPDAYPCAECGAEFLGEPARRAHGDVRHRVSPLSPFDEDRLVEREERLLEQTAPLYLDKTAATLR